MVVIKMDEVKGRVHFLLKVPIRGYKWLPCP